MHRDLRRIQKNATQHNSFEHEITTTGSWLSHGRFDNSHGLRIFSFANHNPFPCVFFFKGRTERSCGFTSDLDIYSYVEGGNTGTGTLELRFKVNIQHRSHGKCELQKQYATYYKLSQT